MLKVATVCCTPPARSWILMGWRIALTPTLSIASLRESGVAWTSGMFCRSRAFIAPILLGHRVPDGLLDSRAVEAHGCKQPARVAVIDETVGQPEEQHLRFPAKDFTHCGTRAAHHLVLFDRDEKLMRARQLAHHSRVERLHKAHVDHGRVEGLARLERGFQHRAEREDRDAFPGTADLRLPYTERMHLAPGIAERGAARITHRRRG